MADPVLSFDPNAAKHATGMEKSLEKIEALLTHIATSSGGLRGNFAEADREAKKFGGSLTHVARLFGSSRLAALSIVPSVKFLNQESVKLQGTIKGLKEEIAKTFDPSDIDNWAKGVEPLVDQLAEAEQQLRVIKQHTEEISKSRKMADVFDKMGSAIGAASPALGGLVSGMGRLVVMNPATMAVALGAGFAKAANEAADVHGQVVKLSSHMSLLTDRTDEVRHALREVAFAGHISVEEAAAFVSQIGAAGIKADELATISRDMYETQTALNIPLAAQVELYKKITRDAGNFGGTLAEGQRLTKNLIREAAVLGQGIRDWSPEEMVEGVGKLVKMTSGLNYDASNLPKQFILLYTAAGLATLGLAKARGMSKDMVKAIGDMTTGMQGATVEAKLMALAFLKPGANFKELAKDIQDVTLGRTLTGGTIKGPQLMLNMALAPLVRMIEGSFAAQPDSTQDMLATLGQLVGEQTLPGLDPQILGRIAQHVAASVMNGKEVLQATEGSGSSLLDATKAVGAETRAAGTADEKTSRMLESGFLPMALIDKSIEEKTGEIVKWTGQIAGYTKLLAAQAGFAVFGDETGEKMQRAGELMGRGFTEEEAAASAEDLQKLKNLYKSRVGVGSEEAEIALEEIMRRFDEILKRGGKGKAAEFLRAEATVFEPARAAEEELTSRRTILERGTPEERAQAAEDYRKAVAEADAAASARREYVADQAKALADQRSKRRPMLEEAAATKAAEGIIRSANPEMPQEQVAGLARMGLGKYEEEEETLAGADISRHDWMVALGEAIRPDPKTGALPTLPEEVQKAYPGFDPAAPDARVIILGDKLLLAARTFKDRTMALSEIGISLEQFTYVINEVNSALKRLVGPRALQVFFQFDPPEKSASAGGS